MLSRIIASFSFAIILILIFMVACNSPKLAEKENNMVRGEVIPPIDSFAPTFTKTATFGLG